MRLVPDLRGRRYFIGRARDIMLDAKRSVARLGMSVRSREEVGGENMSFPFFVLRELTRSKFRLTKNMIVFGGELDKMALPDLTTATEER